MKQSAFLFASIILVAFAVPALGQADMAFWGFEVVTPPDSAGPSSGPWAADAGVYAATSGATGVHASATTAWTTPAGNGSANSFSSSQWAVGDYYQFTTSSLGYSGIKVSWDQTSSSTGPRDFQLLWSNGGVYNPVPPDYIVLANAAPNPTWNSTTGSSIYSYLVSLKDIPVLDDQATISFRLVDVSTLSAGTTGNPVATAGTDRVDNFLVHANVTIPEPVSLVLLGLGGLLIGRRRA